MNSSEKETEQTSTQEKTSEEIYIFYKESNQVWSCRNGKASWICFSKGGFYTTNYYSGMTLSSMKENKVRDLFGSGNWFTDREQVATWMLSNGKIQPKRR